MIGGNGFSMSPSLIWKLVLAVVLGVTIFASAFVRPPRKTFPRDDLRLMVTGALALYTVGLIASFTSRSTVAAVCYASGISISAFAVWLSRGADSGGPPRDQEPSDSPPPVDPRDPPEFDWEAFERELGVYTARRERERELTR